MILDVAAADSVYAHPFNKKEKMYLLGGDYRFCSSGIYGLVGSDFSGAVALSFLMSGCLQMKKNIILKDNEKISKAQLKEIGCIIGSDKYCYSFRSSIPVRSAIEFGLEKNSSSVTPEDIANKFCLTKERLERRLAYTGNEHLRASIAIAEAYGKEIFCCPFISGSNWRRYYGMYLEEWFRYLKNEGKIVIVPIDKPGPFGDLFDEVINVL